MALVLLTIACTSTTPPPVPTKVEAKAPKLAAPEPTPPKPAAPTPTDTAAPPLEADIALPESMPGQWTCVNDVDCAQTCALGAVSRAWLARNRDADPCDDGCGWKSGNQACRDGECITLTEDGDIDEACTKRHVAPPR